MNHFAGLIGVLTLCSIATAQKTRDVVWPVGEKMISGAIQDVTADGLTIDEKGTTRKIAVNDIDRLKLDDEPSGLSKVRSDLENGQIEQAKRSLDRLKPSSRKLVKQDVEFYKAMIASRLALRGDGDLTGAGKLMKRFIDGNADSLRFYAACEMMGDLAMGLGKFKFATSYYGRLTQSKSASIVARGNLLQADALFQQENTPAALSKYQLATKTRDAKTKSLGQVGVAKCQAAAGKHATAIKVLEKLISDHPSQDTELFARAYNALGFAHGKAGDTNASLESYLYTDLLFYRESSQHAEALYHLASLWSRVSKPAESARARATLKEKHAATLWAKK